jgi:hypothetical protein
MSKEPPDLAVLRDLVSRGTGLQAHEALDCYVWQYPKGRLGAAGIVLGPSKQGCGLLTPEDIGEAVLVLCGYAENAVECPSLSIIVTSETPYENCKTAILNLCETVGIPATFTS